MTRTIPRRLTILQFSQIRFTELRTFMFQQPLLVIPYFRKVIRPLVRS